MAAAISAVLFDLGGTLLSYHRREQMRVPTLRALQRLGVDTRDASVLAVRQAAADEVDLEYSARSAFVYRDLFRDRLVRTAAALGVTVTPEVLRTFDTENHRAIVDNLHPREDAHATLEALRDRGIYLAVVSNADDDFLDELMDVRGIAQRVDHWTSSETAQSCKPDSRIYSYALEKAGRTAADALFVGDSLAHDIAGAHAAGLRSVLIEEPGVVAPMSAGLDVHVRPDFVVTALSEIVEIVDAANR